MAVIIGVVVVFCYKRIFFLVEKIIMIEILKVAASLSELLFFCIAKPRRTSIVLFVILGFKYRQLLQQPRNF